MKKGFTLIELLIVMIIISALVAVAVPQYKRTTERSRALIGLSDLRQIADRLNTLYVVNDSYPSAGEFASVINDGVGRVDSSLFAAPVYNHDESTVTLSRLATSGWSYSLKVGFSNGVTTSLTCIDGTTAEVCAQLGLQNNLMEVK